MNVTTEDIRSIPPGALRIFKCEDGKKMRSACSLVTTVKRTEMPDGVVDYETRKEFDTNIVIIRALREGDNKVLNR
jgi:hypothetical protein